MWCICVPPILLFIDFNFNKIRIPLRQIWFTVLITGIFLLTNYIGQIALHNNHVDLPYQPQNLNWNCRENYSYLVQKMDLNETAI